MLAWPLSCLTLCESSLAGFVSQISWVSSLTCKVAGLRGFFYKRVAALLGALLKDSTGAQMWWKHGQPVHGYWLTCS